jgi:hypothetical protein
MVGEEDPTPKRGEHGPFTTLALGEENKVTHVSTAPARAGQKKKPSDTLTTLVTGEEQGRGGTEGGGGNPFGAF